MTTTQWATEFANQQLKPIEMRVLAIVGAIGPVCHGRIGEINGRHKPYDGGSEREWNALESLRAMGLVTLTNYGWDVTTHPYAGDGGSEPATLEVNALTSNQRGGPRR